jgi:hypothetical protein
VSPGTWVPFDCDDCDDCSGCVDRHIYVSLPAGPWVLL